MLLHHDRAGRTNWVSNVRMLLCKHGFGYVWEMQMPGNPRLFIEIFRNRITDCARQSWHDSVSSQPDYSNYHPEIVKANYIDDLHSYELRRALCLLRSNRLPLCGIQRFGKQHQNPFCKQCELHCIEDLKHFVLICPRYLALRKKYIPNYYTRFPSDFKIQMMCLNLKGKLAFKMALYVTEALKIKDTNM